MGRHVRAEISPPLHLKAEWQAAEAIKIELLSLAARALLIGGGGQWGCLARLHSQTSVPVDPVWAACVNAPPIHLHLKEAHSANVRLYLVSFPSGSSTESSRPPLIADKLHLTTSRSMTVG